MPVFASFFLTGAMGMFFETTTQLGFLNTAVFALLVFGPGLSPLPQTMPGPPSTCDAPFTFFERVGLLHYLFLGMVVVSCFLGSHARRIVAAEGGAGDLLAMDAGTKLRARSCMLLAVVFSAVAAGLAVSVYTYILQIKYVVFLCMPVWVRCVVFSVDAIIAIAATYTYGEMVRAVLFAD